MNMTILDIVFYVIYMVVVMLMVHGHRSIGVAYRTTETIENILVTPSCDDCTFLKEVSLFFFFLMGVCGRGWGVERGWLWFFFFCVFFFFFFFFVMQILTFISSMQQYFTGHHHYKRDNKPTIQQSYRQMQSSL